MRVLLSCGAAPDITVAATRGLLAGDARDRLAQLPLRRVLVTGMLATRQTRQLPLQVRSVVPLLADAIDRLHNSEPLDNGQCVYLLAVVKQDGLRAMFGACGFAFLVWGFGVRFAGWNGGGYRLLVKDWDARTEVATPATPPDPGGVPYTWHGLADSSPAVERRQAAMTSIAHRIATLFRTKANKALDRAEDPREVLDYSYTQQQEMLQKVRRGVADVATSRKRIEVQINQLQQSSGKLEGQAQQALAAGREDLAREALSRRTAVASQLTDLQTQQASVQAEEEKLTLASQRLQAKVDTFRTSKETIKARYTAAEAQTRITEAVTGIGEEMGDVGMAMQRAEDKTEQLQARAGALDELLASGALEDATLPAGRDDIQAELERVTAGEDVDRELARMKAQLPPSATPPAVEGKSAEQGPPDQEATS